MPPRNGAESKAILDRGKAIYAMPQDLQSPAATSRQQATFKSSSCFPAPSWPGRDSHRSGMVLLGILTTCPTAGNTAPHSTSREGGPHGGLGTPARCRHSPRDRPQGVPLSPRAHSCLGLFTELSGVSSAQGCASATWALQRNQATTLSTTAPCWAGVVRSRCWLLQASCPPTLHSSPWHTPSGTF